MKKTQSIISICLCLTLLFSVVSFPIQVKADFAFALTYTLRAILGSIFISGTKEVSKFTSNEMYEFSSGLYDLFSDGVQDYLHEQEVYNESLSSTTGVHKFQLKNTYIDEMLRLLTENAVFFTRFNIKTGVLKNYYSDLQAKSENLEIFVPSEKALEYPQLITQEQLLSTGDFVEVLYANNVLLTQVHQELISLRNSFAYSIKLLRTDLVTWTGHVNDTVAEFGRDTEIWLGNVNSSVSTWGRSTVDWVKNVNANLVHYSGVLGQKIDNIALKFDALVEVFPEISQRLDSIVEKIPAYVEPEVIPKPNIQVEVGSQVLAVTDYQSLGKAFEMKLSWIPQIFNFLRELFEQITYTGVPPKVILNLSSSDPDSPWNRDVTILDMSFYEPYKNYGDKVISGFMWLAFGWTLYKRVPDVLNGAGISQDPALSLDSGYSSIGKYEKKRKNGGKHSD